MTIKLYKDDDTVINLPTINVICDRCRGEGHHSNPAIDGNGISGQQWDEWDEEDRDAYMSGAYDVLCDECHGNRVIQVADRSRISDNDWVEYQRQLDVEADAAACQASELRMGA